MLSQLRPDLIITEDISAFFNSKAVVHVLRLDRIDPVISGNKWFKLRYYLDEVRLKQKRGILSFGGAWSNHIVATAAACHNAGLESIGIIRGEKSDSPSPTLMQAGEYGMKLVHVSRADYAGKIIPAGIDTSEFLVVNEGGYGKTGAAGASTILDHAEFNYTHYGCAVGTGTMMAGLINKINSDQQVTGISVLKNNFQLQESVHSLLDSQNKSWSIIHDYSFGGYAKHQPTLFEFMNDFYKQTGIPTDFVYTGKLFYAFNDLIKKNHFPPSSKILLIHSGGLQGNTSISPGTLMF